MLVKSFKIHRDCVPFCAGLACGILISFFLFLLFASQALYNQLWFKSGQNLIQIDSITSDHSEFEFLQPGNLVVHERKLSQDLGNSEEIVNQEKKSIPIEVQSKSDANEKLSWESNLSPEHIPKYLHKELELKKKVFVGIVHPSIAAPSLLDIHHKTWLKGWVDKGHGDITIYAPMGMEVSRDNSVQIFHMSASSTNQAEPSAAMMYQVLIDICSQHVDTHHHFFIANSNAYIHLPRLLNFTNHLDESVSMWLGKRMASSENERTFSNDPIYHCALGPGFLLTRSSIQQLCPHIVKCKRNYSETNVATGLLVARCVLRFLNLTCMQPQNDLFRITNHKEVDDPFADETPFVESISFHPMLDEVSMLKLHYYFLNEQLNNTIRLNDYYYNVVQEMDRALVQEGGLAEDRLILGKNGHANKYEHGDIISWDKIEMTHQHNKIFMVDSSEPSHDITEDDMVVLDKVKNFALGEVKKEYGWEDSLSIETMFRRVVPGVGFQYMVDVVYTDKEIATVYIDQPYEKLQPINVQIESDVTIEFVLPLQDGDPRFKDFMQMFEQACMSGNIAGNVALLLVLFLNTSESKLEFSEKTSSSLKLLNLYKQKYPNLSLRWINSGSDKFSYMRGIDIAVQSLPSATLLCSTDVLIQMSSQFLHHARFNTEPGERVYFPSAFQELQNDNFESRDISRSSGFWRYFDYQLFCGYQQDITRAVRGESLSSGANLYEHVLASGLDVFRAPEYALSVKFSEMDCSRDSLSENEQTTCKENNRNIHLLASFIR